MCQVVGFCNIDFDIDWNEDELADLSLLFLKCQNTHFTLCSHNFEALFEKGDKYVYVHKV